MTAAPNAGVSYDRPLRLSGNVVYELPYFREQQGFVGHVLGGWQLNSFFSFQSGAPFSPLNGTDPTGTLGGLATAIGIATRANVATGVDVSQLSVEEMYALRGTVNASGTTRFPDATAGQRVGNAGATSCAPTGSTTLTSAS